MTILMAKIMILFKLGNCQGCDHDHSLVLVMIMIKIKFMVMVNCSIDHIHSNDHDSTVVQVCTVGWSDF